MKNLALKNNNVTKVVHRYYFNTYNICITKNMTNNSVTHNSGFRIARRTKQNDGLMKQVLQTSE
jgi:hypothetical protein